MSFEKCMQSYNWLNHQDIEQLHHPQSSCMSLPILYHLAHDNDQCNFYHYSFLFFRIPINGTFCIQLLSLRIMLWQVIAFIGNLFFLLWYIIPSHKMSKYFYPFLTWWIFGWFSALAVCKDPCFHFPLVNTEEWKCWGMW